MSYASTSNLSHPVTRGEGLLYLVEERPNPSTDYFVLPAVAQSGLRVVRCDFSDLPLAADLEGAAVVFVRYVPSSWIKLVDAVRPMLSALVYFMDDDLLDARVTSGMSWRYRFKLARLATWRSAWLHHQGAELWVSTPYLQQKYAAWHAQLVLPSPITAPSGVCSVFYHGSSSHAAEIRWLRPVIEEALRCEERLAFGIVGGQEVYHLYRGLPRVNVMHPMSWSAYQHLLSMPGRHIGLAPLMDTSFNRARSYTKFFDFTRCEAVGIYSPNGACAGVIKDGVNGMIAELRQDAWIEAILKLAHDETLRQSMLHNAKVSADELADKAKLGYSGLLKQSYANKP